VVPLHQMIEQALNVLNLHIIWKARGLTSATDLSMDEIQYGNSLKDQRASLMEKLVEYAVGTQSNTVEGVKRTVSGLDLSAFILW
jgi:cohesin complex subunit SA-1/2